MLDVIGLLHQRSWAVGAIALHDGRIPVRIVAMSMMTCIVRVVAGGLVIGMVLHRSLGEPVLVAPISRGRRRDVIGSRVPGVGRGDGSLRAWPVLRVHPHGVLPMVSLPLRVLLCGVSGHVDGAQDGRTRRDVGRRGNIVGADERSLDRAERSQALAGKVSSSLLRCKPLLPVVKPGLVVVALV